MWWTKNNCQSLTGRFLSNNICYVKIVFRFATLYILSAKKLNECKNGKKGKNLSFWHLHRWYFCLLVLVQRCYSFSRFFLLMVVCRHDTIENSRIYQLESVYVYNIIFMETDLSSGEKYWRWKNFCRKKLKLNFLDLRFNRSDHLSENCDSFEFFTLIFS